MNLHFSGAKRIDQMFMDSIDKDYQLIKVHARPGICLGTDVFRIP